ncbi:MAG: hypothetical protein ACOYOL_11425 [Chthoniobacterales bacterium]
MKPHACLVLILLISGVSSRAQTPAPTPPPPVAIEEFKVESAPAPGGGTWLRLLAPFRTSPKWADGIAFYYDVLVEKDGQFRVLSGTARYANVKAGRQAAVLYMSPSAAERFGVPIAAEIRVGYNDEVVQSFKWEAPGKKAPEGWGTQFQRYPNLIQPIYLTPFVATEYGKYPDAISSQ